MPSQRAARYAAFRDELIPDTIANAATIAFYRQLWDGIDVAGIKTVADLRRLPAFDKEQYRASFQFDFPHQAELASIGHTTGTTGELVFRHRTVDEIAEQHGFIRAAIEGARHPGDVRPLVALIGSPGHGHAIRAPMNGIPITGTLDNAHRIDQLIQILTRSFRIPGYTDRVVELQSSPDEIEQLTFALLGAGIDPGDLAVERITLVSAYVSAPFRRFVREVWGDVAVVDRYSLSEVVGGSTFFEDCGAFHPDPHLAVELVDPFTGEPAPAGGVAVPVLTELFPLVRFQPFVRYWSNDVAERRNCADEPLAFVVHGRLHETPLRRLDDGTTEILCSPARLQDYLQSLPLVARASLVEHLPGVAPVRVGPAVVDLSHRPPDEGGDRGTVSVRVGVVFDPTLYSAPARDLVAEIADRLRDDNPGLARAIADGYRLDVTLRAVGAR